MTQEEKQAQINKLKVEAFDAFQAIERSKFQYNKILEEMVKLDQTPVEDSIPPQELDTEQ